MTKVTKTKILIFIDWFEPAYKAGGPIRSVFGIVQFLRNEAEITVVTSNKDLGEEIPLEGVVANEWQMKDKYTIIYLDSTKQNVAQYKTIIKEVAPNTIYLNSLFSNNFTLLPIQAYRQLNCKARLIIAPRGMFSPGALAIKKWKKKVFFIYAKLLGVFNHVIWHASSTVEKEEIMAKIGKKARVVIASNMGYLPETNFIKKKTEASINIICVARISPIKNIHLLIESLAVSENKERINLTIIGNNEDEEYFKKCNEIAVSNQLKVNFVAAMPYGELANFYQNSDAFCLPTSNENFGHAIIEALSYGLPIVISQHTPWRNLKEKGVGFDLPLDAASFAKALDEIFELSDEAYLEMRKRARAFAETVLLNPEVEKANRALFLEK
jgi:glycosyltransferase involved in cell wall biosynthesis